jgi:hypothetical protein
MAISDEILELVAQAQQGELDDVTSGDMQAITEALAMKIINQVREA